MPPGFSRSATTGRNASMKSRPRSPPAYDARMSRARLIGLDGTYGGLQKMTSTWHPGRKKDNISPFTQSMTPELWHSLKVSVAACILTSTARWKTCKLRVLHSSRNVLLTRPPPGPTSIVTNPERAFPSSAMAKSSRRESTRRYVSSDSG